jgi:hypothetical protein
MESSWSNGKAAYRCRHGRTSAAAPNPGHPKNAYIREDRAMEHLPAQHLILTGGNSRLRVGGALAAALTSGLPSARKPRPGSSATTKSSSFTTRQPESCMPIPAAP